MVLASTIVTERDTAQHVRSVTERDTDQHVPSMTERDTGQHAPNVTESGCVLLSVPERGSALRGLTTP